MPDTIQSEREIRSWERSKKLLGCIDVCREARQRVLAGDWVHAIEWAMMAGQRSLLDQAQDGRRSARARPKRGVKRPLSADLAARNALIVAEAEAMQAQNPRLSLKAIANRIADRHPGEERFPGAEAVRKILAGARKLGTQGLRAQV